MARDGLTATGGPIWTEQAGDTETRPGPGHTRAASSPRGAVVAAAAALMRQGGASAVTTRAVAQAAGVQAPAIYRLFGDKDGLLDAVAEHVMAAWVQDKAHTADAAAAHQDPLADLVAGWHSQVGFGLANPDLYALINTPGRAKRSPATAAGTAVLDGRLQRLAAAGLLAVDVHRASGLLRAAGVGTVTTLLTSSRNHASEGLSEAVLDAVLDAVLVPGARTARTDRRSDHENKDGAGGGRATDALTPVTAAVALLAHLPDLPSLSAAERALIAEQLTRAVTASRDTPRRDPPVAPAQDETGRR